MRNYSKDYPGFVNAPNAAYPQGSPKNATTDTAEDGTPVEQGWVADQWGFMQSVMHEAGDTPNEQSESVSNPQVLNALKKITNGIVTQVLSANGYTTYKSGKTEQWGLYTLNAKSTQTFNFPVTFAESCFVIVGNFLIPAQGTLNLDLVSASQFKAQNTYPVSQSFRMIAIGK